MVWAPDYSTLERVKNYLRIEPDDTEDDDFISLWITTVSRNVDDHCGRQFGTVDGVEARTYTHHAHDGRTNRYVTEIDDVYDTAGLTVTDEVGTAVTGFTFEPENAAQRGKPVERIVTARPGPLVLTTDAWGWETVPAAVEVSMFLQAARLASRRDSPFGIAGSPSEGSEMRLLAQLDPDFRTSLKPLRRKWWAR